MNTQRIALTALGVALIGSSALAAGRIATPVDMKEIKNAPVDSAYRIDAQGKRVGPIHYANPILNAAREVPSWKMAFDNVKWDLTANTVAGGMYGAPNAYYTLNWSAAARYNAPTIANDVMLVPGSEGKFASRFAMVSLWNPGGIAPGVTVSGTPTTRIVQIFGLSSYVSTDADGPKAIITGGIALSNTNLAGGGWAMTFDASTFNLGVPLPYSDAGYLVKIGTADANGNFVMLPTGNTQMFQCSFQSPTEPSGAGTNPSSSDKFQWEDYTSGAGTANTPDFIFQTTTNTSSQPTPYSELGDNTYSIAGLPVQLQASVAMAYDDNLPLAAGKVSYSDLSFSVLAQPITVVPVDASGTPLTGSLDKTFTIPVRVSDGKVTVPSLVLNDALGDPLTTKFKLTMKLRGMLRKTTGIWDTTAGAFTFDWDIKGGDIDNDNSVTVFDYDKLSTYFDKNSADSDWDTADGDGIAPVDADIDGDGAVTVFDYDVLSRNFDLVGDEAP